MYHIYYLPNAVRKYSNALGEAVTIKGKVGFASGYASNRKARNKYVGLNTDGHIVLISDIQSKSKAKRLEKRYQQILRCEEPGPKFYHKGKKK